MHSTVLAHGPTMVYTLVLDEGEELTESLDAFARQNHVDAASISAVGAVSDATLGFFDPDISDYLAIPVTEQAEVVSLVGDITCAETDEKRADASARTVHGHMVVALADGRTIGGHLLRGHVRPTMEIIVTETPAQLRRTYRPDSGLALIDLPASAVPSGS